MSKEVELILGTMTFGPQVDDLDAAKMIELFTRAGHHELDAAYVYNEGETERILGKIVDSDEVRLATKVNPRITGKLDADAVNSQFEESLSRLKRTSVDLLYFHFPDPSTPPEGPLEAVHKLYEEGKFKEFGLSNYPAWEVSKLYHLCDKYGWIRPTVYQGMYNALSRGVESELFHAIRDFKMRFYAYNPLAGGLLSGKYSRFNDSPEPGRFTHRPNYKDRYWKESFFEALDLIGKECEKEGITLVDAAFRWLAKHSFLDPSQGDGIIVGVSKLGHLEKNLSFIHKPNLPNNLLRSFDEAWESTKKDEPSYFRYLPKKASIKPSSSYAG